MTIQTLNGDCKHSAIAADGLTASNVEQRKGEWIILPKASAQDDLPAASDETATSENIQKWKYLLNIIPKIKTFDDQDV